MDGQKTLSRVLNIILGAIMEDAQILSGLGEKTEESKYHLESSKRKITVHNMLLYRLWQGGGCYDY